MDNKTDINTARIKLQNAILERDGWRGVSDHHFHLASKLVEALTKALQEAEKNSNG